MKPISISRMSLSLVIVCGCLFATPKVEAGMIGDLWNTVLGWFGKGTPKIDSQAEAQIAALLERANQSQNTVIASINDTLTFQNQLQSLPDEATRGRLEEMIQDMQKSVENNNAVFLELMQTREQIKAQGLSANYEDNFAPYIQKQQEIESYYSKIEERYQELTAFSETAPSDKVGAVGSGAEDADLWQKAQARSLIEEWLELNGRDAWAGPKVEGAVIGRPQAAGSRDRHQYLFESFPEIRAYVADRLGGVTTDSPSASSSSGLELGKGSSGGQVNPTASTKVPGKSSAGMAFSNRYDHASIREERKKIYKKLLDMNVQGKMDSEEYKDLYLEYTKLGEQLQ